MLPAVLYGKQQPEERQNGTTPISPLQPNEEAEGIPLNSAPYVLQGPFRSRSRLRNRPFFLSVAAIISVATLFLIMVSVCNEWRNRTQVSGATRRRLSYNTNEVSEEEQSIVDGCLDLESELGILYGRGTYQTETYPARNVEGLVSMLQTAAAQYEAMQEMPTSHGGAGAPHIVPGPIHSPSHEQVLGLQTSFQMPLSMDDSPPSSASPSEIQSRLDENLSGVHDLFQPHAYQQPLGLQTTFNVMPSMGGPTAFHVFPGALQGRSDEHLPGVQGANQPHYTEVGNTIAYPWFESPADRSPLDETEAFDEDAWLEQIPDIVSGQGGGGEAPLGPYVISDSPEGSVSTSSADISPPSDADAMQDDDFDINTHPFVRLPVLEDGVVIRHMEVKDLFKPFRGKVQPYFYLSTLRALFAKSVLDQDDVNKLVNAVEGLIGAAWHQAQRRFRKTRPLYAAEALGKNFLALDAIICAIQLLGDTMSVSTWWDEFISAFNCDPSIYLPPLVRQISVSNRRLIRRLLNVLEIYKKGERPSAEEVYEIKKKLFCSEDAPLHFKDFKWTPWRKDGNCSWK